MKLLTPDFLHGYQQKAVNFQCSNPHTMLWVSMGLGKTVITLTSLAHLINTGFLKGVLIVAPIRVIRLVWKQEAAKWEHTKHLKFSMVTGSRDQRTRALLRPADVYLVNYENMEWLAQTLETYFIKKDKPMPFNGVVWDEISKMKNSSTNRVRAIKKVLDHFQWTTGLTGTPASNGYKDLHGQFLVVDKGERLGTSKTAFRTRFYKKVGPYKEVAYEDTEDTIKRLIGDITLEMSAEDYNPLPDLVVNNIELEMPEELRAKYNQMEKEFFMTLDSGTNIEVFNQAALTNKCISEGTEVLTKNGWKPIEQVQKSDQVWDGVEWVNVSGIVYNGYKKVIDCWGVLMTPDHQVLTDHGWKQAQEITNEQPGKRYDRSKVRLPDCITQRGQQNNIRNFSTSYMESAVRLWQRVSTTGAKFKTSRQNEAEILWLSSWRNHTVSRNDWFTNLGYLAKHEISLFKPVRQRLGKLWRSWNQSMFGMGSIIRGILERHVGRLLGSFNFRTNQCKCRLHKDKLQVGNQEGAGKQHTPECVHSDTRWVNDSCSSCREIQYQTDNIVQTSRQRLDWGTPTEAHVYDIANAGPRHRFTVRGKNGEVFIAHNCLQFSNGAMYPVAGMPLWEPIHDLKLEALEEIIDEAQGSPVLCAYAYRSDAERIMKKFEKLRPINLTECKSEMALNNAMHRWKTGDCALMIGHPASMGHGIDGLQRNGHIVVWYGLNWSLDLYEQMNARVRRQGQGVPVICHRIMMRDTLDQAQAMALDDKADTQAGLRKAIKEYRLTRGM